MNTPYQPINIAYPHAIGSRPKSSSQIGSVALLFSLVILSLLRSHSHFGVRMAGDVCLTLFVVISGFVLFIHLTRFNGTPAFVRNVILAFGFASLFYFASTTYTDRLNNPSIAFYRGAQVLAIAVVICAFYFCGRVYNGERLIERIARLGTWASLCFSLMTIFAYTALSSVRDIGFTNENAVGLFLTTFAFFPLAIKRGKWLKGTAVLLAMFAILLTGSRTAVGAFACGLGTYIFWTPIQYNKLLFWGGWVLVFVFAYFAIYFLSDEFDFADLAEVNVISRDVTGKNLLSGRDRMWPLALELIRDKPWFGWGGGSNVSSMIMSHSSEHNMFLQTLLQVGFAGLAAIVLAATSVWAGFQNLSDPKKSRFVRVGAALLISTMMCQHFEITLFQTNLGLSMPMWAMVGLIIGAGQPD